MRLSYGLEAKQLQKQTLAPRMIQSMEILQMPIAALQERIDQELSENPMLEQQDVDPALPDVQDEDQERPTSLSDVERELVVKDNQSNADDFERLFNMDQDMPNTFDDFRRSSGRIDEDGDRYLDMMANAVARPESLNDYLLHQLAELDIDDQVEVMAEKIISSLDARDGGYFRTSLRDLLPTDHSDKDFQIAQEALRVVQALDPPGIAARDLRECLLNQLRPEMHYFDEMKRLIDDHLEDLAENRLPLIHKKTGFSIETIQEAKQELHMLNPKPGRAFMETYVPSVTPDVIVELDENGKYVVKLEDDRLPTLRISEYYRRRLMSGEATAAEKEFIKKKVVGAQWLIDAIQQRRSTLQKVSQAIIDYQRKFLEQGPEAIEPLKMQQIADQVGVHVTTVSRAVDDKWVQTPRGIMPLKRFFVGGTRSEDGEDVAWDTIRVKLQEIIDKEDKQNPLSDDDLVKALGTHGLNVARRTITKYRKKMGIPSSRQRRDWSLGDAPADGQDDDDKSE
jgi:RNA polymerase sigma-54 factor